MSSTFTILEDTLQTEQIAYRTKLLIGLSIFFIAFLSLFISFYLGRSIHAATDTVDNIHTISKTSDSENIDWHGPEQGIFYGLTTRYGEAGIATGTITSSDDSTEPLMRVQLTGLQPGTMYHFKIGLYGMDHTFRTKP